MDPMDVLHNTGFGDVETLDVLCGAWRNLLDAVEPDMLVCDHAPMALLASRWRQLRRVVVGTGFTVPPAVSPWPDLRYWSETNAADPTLQRDEKQIAANVNALLDRHRLPGVANLAAIYEADATFLMTFQELDHYPERIDGSYCGTWIPRGEAAPEWPEGKGPRLFGYLKPPEAGWQLREFLGFLRELRLPTLVYMAGGERDWLKKMETPRLRFTFQPIDVRQTASQCDIAILHGNAGSVAAFLLHGVPQLNLPLFLEQTILSRRVVEMGAGLIANPNRPEQMAARLTVMLHDNRYRKAAAAFAGRYAHYDQEQSMGTMLSQIQELLRL